MKNTRRGRAGGLSQNGTRPNDVATTETEKHDTMKTAGLGQGPAPGQGAAPPGRHPLGIHVRGIALLRCTSPTTHACPHWWKVPGHAPLVLQSVRTSPHARPKPAQTFAPLEPEGP